MLSGVDGVLIMVSRTAPGLPHKRILSPLPDRNPQSPSPQEKFAAVHELMDIPLASLYRSSSSVLKLTLLAGCSPENGVRCDVLTVTCCNLRRSSRHIRLQQEHAV